jgi:hypothetical protein
MDFGYFIEAKSDAYSLNEKGPAIKPGWDYGCEYQVLYKFRRPITIADVRDDPYLAEWGAFRANFQRSAYSIPPNILHHLVERMAEREPTFGRFLRRGGIKNAAYKILREEELENRLPARISVLRPLGFELEVRERQLICAGHRGSNTSQMEGPLMV